MEKIGLNQTSYSAEWSEHRALFQGRVSGHERRLKINPVRDIPIDLSRKSKGIRGHEVEQERKSERREAWVQAIVEWTPPVEVAPEQPTGPIKPTIKEIQAEICRQYLVSLNDICSERRSMSVVRPRQVGMMLAKILTLRSLPYIGGCFGGKDHTTVLHATRKTEPLKKKLLAIMPENATLEEWVKAARAQWTEVGLK